MEARSEGLGKGSELLIRLSLHTGAVFLAGEQPSGQTKPQRILIVEDNRDAAESMCVLLRLAGHEVDAVHSGLLALEAVDTFQPEVVICDISLPGGMDGYEVARSLRLDPALENILLIALTGYGQDEDVRRAHEAGFDWHLVKPIDFNELQRVLATLGNKP